MPSESPSDSNIALILKCESECKADHINKEKVIAPGSTCPSPFNLTN